MKYVFDMVRNKALHLENGIAYDDVSGETFNYTLDDEAEFQPLPFSIYETVIINLTHWYESNMTEHEWIEEINAKLLPYGI
ncbi:hypothetical protein [Metabacillus halosaccharovorans]|uniref:hypothetical protein n=1 Tax=Metabacillus halosaccharovorans TaxID=930124 RepID=UPI001C1FCA67|nr:hypothetical protein [Metabacillus halosaccharovorans]MBU7593552.1 hypothetical protein [Metabacillus halosaccharovorans]